MTEHQEDIRDALKRMYGCDCTYLESVTVGHLHKMTVEVFAIHGHPDAVKVYGWSTEQQGDFNYIGVLHRGVVDSPEMAILTATLEGES